MRNKCLVFNDTPSERIEFALEAMKEIESTGGHGIHMGTYHSVRLNDCFHCCGGAAALKKFVKKTEWTDTKKIMSLRFNPDICRYESSLDYAKEGMIWDVFECMGLNSEIGSQFGRSIADYHENRIQFYKDMEKLASDLKEAGY